MHTYVHKNFHTQEYAYTHAHIALFLSVDSGFQPNEVEVLEISLIPLAPHVHGLSITLPSAVTNANTDPTLNITSAQNWSL